MPDFRVVRPLMLAAGVLAIAGCASQSASMSAASDALDERYFQAEAANYLKFEHQGRVVYCQNETTVGSLVPTRECIWESALREKVKQFRRERNGVAYAKW